MAVTNDDQPLVGKWILNQLQRDLGVSTVAEGPCPDNRVSRPCNASGSAKSVVDDELDMMSVVSALHWLTPPRRSTLS